MIRNPPAAARGQWEAALGPHVTARAGSADRPLVSLDYHPDVAPPAGAYRVSRRVAGLGADAYFFDGNSLTTRARLDTAGTISQVTAQPGSDFDHVFGVAMLAVHTALAAAGLVFLHAMALRLGQETLLLPATANTGKTILGLSLIEHGAVLAGDDWCLLEPSGEVRPFLKPTIVAINDLRQHPRLVGFLPLRRRLSTRVYLRFVAQGKIPGGPPGRWRRMADHWMRRRRTGLRVPDRLTLPATEFRTVAPDASLPPGVMVRLRKVHRRESLLEPADPAALSGWAAAVYRDEFARVTPAAGDLLVLGSYERAVHDHLARVHSAYEKAFPHYAAMDLSLPVYDDAADSVSLLLDLMSRRAGAAAE